MKLEQALVVGGDSRLGAALVRELLGRGVTTNSTTRRRGVGFLQPFFDLLDPVLHPTYTEGDWTIFVVAAVTGFGACEKGGDSWRVNADAPGAIARACPRRTVFVSSDAVEFAPHTAYAKQKAYAELAVLAAGGLVLRCGPMTTPAIYALAAGALADLASADVPPGTLCRWQAP